MRDVFFTIMVVWLVYRIYNSIKGSKTFIFQKHEHHHYKNEEGKVKIKQAESKKQTTTADEGEYVDYEEIK